MNNKNVKTIVLVFSFIFIMKLKADDTEVEIRTPRGQLVGDSWVRSSEYSTSTRSQMDDNVRQNYPNVTLITLWNEQYSSSIRYNCHGYAWHMIADDNINHPVWIGLYGGPGNTEQYWNENDESYSSVSEEYADDYEYEDEIMIDYQGDHSAVATWQEDICISKWCDGPLVQHSYTYCPYGSPALFYRKNPATPSMFANIHSALNDALPGQIVHVDSGVPALAANVIVPSGITLKIHSGTTIDFGANYYIKVMPGGALVVEPGATFSPSDRAVRYCGTWNTAIKWKNFPVLVDSNLTITNDSLIVYPGTCVKTNPGKSIIVNGVLIADGSSSQPIAFTSASGTWSGIELNYATASTMSYCTVQNASTGVLAYQANLSLDHCTFSSNSYSGVTFENQASGTVTNSIFSSNSTYAIRCLQYSNPVIRTVNRIWNNYGTAVSGDGSSLPDLGTYYNYGNNSIKNNYPDDIWSDNVNTVYAQYNYWGSSSPDPYVSDNVEWEPYLSSDPTGSLGKAIAGQEMIAILHEKPSSDTTGKQLFGKAYQAWIEGDLEGAKTLFEQLAQECPSSPAGQQALAFAVRCYDESKDTDGAESYLERIIKEKSTSVLSELAMSIKVGRLARLGKYDEAVGSAEKLLHSVTDSTLRKYALYDLVTLLYHFLNDKQNGEKYYRQLMAEFPDDPLAEVAASTLGLTVDEPADEKLAKASTLPTEYELSQNYPNPFNPQTTIQFALPEASQLRIEVMNVLGQRIAVLSDQAMAAGFHMVRWDGRTTSGERASSGMYFCRLQAGSFSKTMKMMLLP